MRLLMVICRSVLFSSFLSSGLLAQGPSSELLKPLSSSRELGDLNAELQALAAHISPSVVKIEVNGYLPVRDPASPNAAFVSRESSIGSGIIVDSSGLILTNAHVVAHAVSVMVTIYDHPNEQNVTPSDVHRLKAKILGQDAITDIALLQVDRTGLPALTLADSDAVRVGQLAIAFGSPLGLENSMTLGVISSTQRQLGGQSPVVYLQTDASINPGNSGGPLIDIHGAVIGMNTMIATQSGGNEGVGFSIPSNSLRFVFDQLKMIGHVRRGTIGISVSAIDPDLAAGLGLNDAPGVILQDVTPGSVADLAGMVPGDVVLAVDGKSLQEPQQLAALLFRKKVGETLRFSIQRVDKSKAELSVTIARRPRDPENMFDPAHLADDLVPRLGIVAIPLSSEVAKLLPLTRKQSGLVVVALTAGGKAALLDFQVGDVLYSINRTPVTTVSELRKTLEGLPEDGSVAIQLERDGKLQFVSFPNPD